MVRAGKIHDGETVKITAGTDGLLFNGAAAKQAAKLSRGGFYGAQRSVRRKHMERNSLQD